VCRRAQLTSAEAVIQQTLTLAAQEAQPCRLPPWTTELTIAPYIQVPLPDLSCFDQLLDSSASCGRSDDETVVIAAAEAASERPVTMILT
jgi:hypothetical protein